jgi:hypothetical protein
MNFNAQPGMTVRALNATAPKHKTFGLTAVIRFAARVNERQSETERGPLLCLKSNNSAASATTTVAQSEGRWKALDNLAK